MADTAVRVDIIVGQNTVVPSVERTQSALAGVSTVAARTNTGFDNLSKGGLKRLESGFQALAFQAAGVPGPLGRIASGLVLLGGGSGVLLGVAAAAGAVALAWKALTTASTDAAAAMDRLKPKLTETQQRLADIKTVQDDIAKNDWWRQLVVGAAMASPAMRFLADAVLETRGALLASAEEGKRAAIEATNKAIVDRINLLNKQGEAEGRRLLAADAAARDKRQALDYRIAVGLTGGPQMADLGESVIALRENLIAPLEEMPERVGRAFADMNEEFVQGLVITQDLIDGINATLFYGFVDMAANVAAALGNGDSVGDVILAALGQMMQDIGRMMITAGIALTNLIPALTNFLTSGPAMIAAGVILSAVGAAASKRAQGGGVHGGAATGGVNSGRYERDQQEMGARGTVTIQMGRDGFIRPSDPVFQEFLAQVIKEAKGRNVVFA